MAHLVLLGDSVFDNKSYVGADQPDVISHLQNLIPDDWRATLAAVDGSVADNVAEQLRQIPSSEATHLFVSVGGNDALMNADVLQMPANSAADVLNELAERAKNFELRYVKMLEGILYLNLPVVVSTVYYPNFPDVFMQKIAVAALSVFNDAIIRQATRAGIPILDLRLICSEQDDYANEIEPSAKGGGKIASKILEVARRHDFSIRRTSVYF